MHGHDMHSSVMNLADFMRTANISDVELAAQVKRDRTNVLRWRTGKTKPDFEALVAIEKISDGKVTASDFARSE